jgi:hypothetical protein
MPEEIARLFGALGYLPPVQDVAEVPLGPAGDWCFNVPLWGNPLLPNAATEAVAENDGSSGHDSDGGDGDADTAVAAATAAAAAAAADPDFTPDGQPPTVAAAMPRPGLDRRHARLATCSALRTVGDAVRIGLAAAHAPRGMAGWEQWVATQLAPADASSFRRSPTMAALRGLLADVSAEWRSAATSVLDRAGGDGQAAAAGLAAAGVESEEMLRAKFVSRVGWRFSPTLAIKLGDLTVGLATRMQLLPVSEQRACLHAAYEREAREQLPAGPPMAAQPAVTPASTVPAVLARLWPIRWEREHKETLWRLAIDGVPLPGNTHLHRMQPEQCGCGGYGGSGPQSCSPRAHHFWECPVAKAVVAQIAAHVPGPISRAHVWLAEAPAGVQQCVWDVVALAALAAMERARAGLRAVAGPAAMGTGVAVGAAEAEAAPQPQQQPPPDGAAAGSATTATPPPIEVAKARAVVDFWQRVRGWAALGTPRKGWGGVGADHPILSVIDGELRCAHPVSLELDADEGS